MWQEQVAKEQRNKITSTHLASSFFLFLFGAPAHGKGTHFRVTLPFSVILPGSARQKHS